MHVSKKLRKKLNNKAWQEIFVVNKEKNLYKIYHPLSRKIHKTRDVDIDKRLLYDKLETNPCEFIDEKWENLNDSLFVDTLEFDKERPEAITTSIPIFEKKILIYHNQAQEEKMLDLRQTMAMIAILS